MNYYKIKNTHADSGQFEGRNSLAARYSRVFAAYASSPIVPNTDSSMRFVSTARDRGIDYGRDDRIPVGELARVYRQEAFVNDSSFRSPASTRKPATNSTSIRLCGRYVVLSTVAVASMISVGMLLLESAHRGGLEIRASAGYVEAMSSIERAIALN